jgi:hypothetical protein
MNRTKALVVAATTAMSISAAAVAYGATFGMFGFGHPGVVPGSFRPVGAAVAPVAQDTPVVAIAPEPTVPPAAAPEAAAVEAPQVTVPAPVPVVRSTSRAAAPPPAPQPTTTTTTEAVAPPHDSGVAPTTTTTAPHEDPTGSSTDPVEHDD